MEQDKRKVITEYLKGPRDYNEGVALYQRFGVNLMLKRRFVVDDTATTREILFDELRKIAGLTESEFAALPRRAKTKQAMIETKAPVKTVPVDDETALIELADSFGVSVDELVSPDFQERVLAMDDNADRIDELTEELEKSPLQICRGPGACQKDDTFPRKISVP